MTPFLPSSRLLATIAGIAIASSLATSSVWADVASGKALMRGTLVIRGNEALLSATFSARDLRSSQGDRVNWNGIGYWRQDRDTVPGAYRGTMRSVSNNNGVVKRYKSTRRIIVTRRSVRTPYGTFRLRRPLRSDDTGTYNVRGDGRIRVRI